MVFGQWMNLCIIYDNISSLIHKKCRPKSYHSDIKYHMTLNIIFSVVFLKHLIYIHVFMHVASLNINLSPC